MVNSTDPKEIPGSDHVQRSDVEPADVRQRAAQRIAATMQDPHRLPRLNGLLHAYPEHVFTPRLYASIEIAERLSVALAHAVANQIDLWRGLDGCHTAADITTTLGLAPGFRSTLDWLLWRLTAAGHVAVRGPSENPRFGPAASPPDSNATNADAILLREAGLLVDPANAATFDLMEHAAAQYPAVARGEITGQDALLNAGTIELWLRYFSNDNPLYAVNNWIAATAAVARLKQRSERCRPLHILEVGAGAGSGTERLADLLRQADLLEQIHLHVTEPSAFLLRKARRALTRADDATCTFANLDINRSWVEQGFKEASIDLVYAVNVLHVAHDLPLTLAYMRQCLAPGGWLVAGECLRPDAGSTLSMEMVFRLLEDPATVTHPERQPRAGFLELRHWQAAISEAGFDGVDCEPDHARIRALYPTLSVAALCAQR